MLCFLHALALAGVVRYVDTYDFCTVETGVRVLVANFLIVGRELVNEQMQGMHAFFLRKSCASLAKDHYALILNFRLICSDNASCKANYL